MTVSFMSSNQKVNTSNQDNSLKKSIGIGLIGAIGGAFYGYNTKTFYKNCMPTDEFMHEFEKVFSECADKKDVKTYLDDFKDILTMFYDKKTNNVKDLKAMHVGEGYREIIERIQRNMKLKKSALFGIVIGLITTIATYFSIKKNN